MPLQRGTTAAVTSLAFVISWGNFLDPLIYVYDERWFTVPLGMRSLSIVPVTDQPLMLAASVMACVPGRWRPSCSCSGASSPIPDERDSA